MKGKQLLLFFFKLAYYSHSYKAIHAVISPTDDIWEKNGNLITLAKKCANTIKYSAGQLFSKFHQNK